MGPQPDLLPAAALDGLAWQIVDGLTQPHALALYRLIVAEGWRFQALALTFEQSGMDALRKRVRDVLKSAGVAHAERDIRASGFISLVPRDAYLEAALGLDDSDRTTRFEKQIASATGFALSRRV